MRVETNGRSSRLRRAVGVLAMMACLALAANALAAAPLVVDYLVEFRPEEGTAAVTITLEPGEGRIIELDFAMNPKRYSGVTGDGALELKDRRAVWQPPREGGSLQFEYRIDKQRRGSGYDARITES